MSVAPRALPDPAIDPSDVQALLPSLSPEQATLAAQLATVAVAAYLYPNPIPQDPTPEPVYAALLGASVRFGRAIQQGFLPVVGESLGSYSYRLDSPGGLVLTADERAWLVPWAPSRGSAFELHLGGELSLPLGWWQSDLDNRLKAADQAVELQ